MASASRSFAALLAVSPERVRQLAAAGTLPSRRTALGRLFRLRDVEQLARQRLARASSTPDLADPCEATPPGVAD
jgi:hypothetical protein